MNAHFTKSTQATQNYSKTRDVSWSRSGLTIETSAPLAFEFVDNRPEAIAQRKLQAMADHSSRVQRLARPQATINCRPCIQAQYLLHNTRENLPRQTSHCPQLARLVSKAPVDIGRASDPNAGECLSTIGDGNSTAQRVPAVIKEPPVPTPDQAAIIADARAIDHLTDASFANTWARLQAMHQQMPIAPQIGQFPGVTPGHYVNFINSLQGNNDQLKAAATGYVIEDQVTHGGALPANAVPQMGVQDAIPDFVVTHGVERGIVDITSTGQVGHVLDKAFNPGNFPVIWESLYPSIDFTQLNGAPPLVGPTAELVQVWKSRRATSRLHSSLSLIKKEMELFSSHGIMQGHGEFRAGAQVVSDRINEYLAEPNRIPIANVDNAITAANAYFPDPYLQRRTLTQLIHAMQQRYGVAGNPPWI